MFIGILLDGAKDFFEIEASLIGYGCAECLKVDSKNDLSDLVRALAASAAAKPTLVAPSLDHFGLSIREAVHLIHELSRHGLHFRSIHDELDTREPLFASQFCMALIATEQRAHLARLRRGLALSRAGGRKLGRRPKLSDGDIAQVEHFLNCGLTVGETAAQLGVARSTLQRHLAARRGTSAPAGGVDSGDSASSEA